MRRFIASLTAVLFLAIVPAALAGPNAAIQWNRVTLGILRTKGAQPPTIHATRTLAMVHSAIDDAVRSAHRRASPSAAAGAAAHDVLVALYPAMGATLDADEASMLAEVRSRARRDAGVAVGQAVARAVVAQRANDGSAATPPAIPPGTVPGAYRPDPPAFAPPVFTHWPAVRPFVLRSGAQFRVTPPPALGSPAYAAALNEVQDLGKSDSATRTADQTQAAQFWAAPIWNYWNEIAQTASLAHHDSLREDAALFARLNLGFADGVIAFYDSKYHYLLWRPVTAIRMADTDGNPATTADPTWTPLGATPADPSYPGAHSVISTIGSDVLGATFGDRFRFAVTSEVLPGVTRTFDRFSGAATDAGLSRIYAGVHTRSDHVAGQRLGHDVAGYVLAHSLSARRGGR